MIALWGNVACFVVAAGLVEILASRLMRPEIYGTPWETLALAGINLAGAVVGALSIHIGFLIAEAQGTH